MFGPYESASVFLRSDLLMAPRAGQLLLLASCRYRKLSEVGYAGVKSQIEQRMRPCHMAAKSRASNTEIFSACGLLCPSKACRELQVETSSTGSEMGPENKSWGNKQLLEIWCWKCVWSVCVRVPTCTFWQMMVSGPVSPGPWSSCCLLSRAPSVNAWREGEDVVFRIE